MLRMLPNAARAVYSQVVASSHFKIIIKKKRDKNHVHEFSRRQPAGAMTILSTKNSAQNLSEINHLTVKVLTQQSGTCVYAPSSLLPDRPQNSTTSSCNAYTETAL